MTKKSSFEVYRQLGIGWKVITNNPQDLKVIRKHFKRIRKQGLISEFSSRRYYVAVSSRFFGLYTKYTVFNSPFSRTKNSTFISY